MKAYSFGNSRLVVFSVVLLRTVRGRGSLQQCEQILINQESGDENARRRELEETRDSEKPILPAGNVINEPFHQNAFGIKLCIIFMFKIELIIK